MDQDGVFKVVDATEAISRRQKAITSTWTMKTKSNGTYCARLVVIGLQQQEGLHYDIAAISSPVTSDTSICMALTIMTIAGYKARIIDVKAAFLKGELENNNFPPLLEKLCHALIRPHGSCSIGVSMY